MTQNSGWNSRVNYQNLCEFGYLFSIFMLSIGIRFGEGFDSGSVIKLMQSVPVEVDYDVVVIGTNPGGVACAKEASLAGKKTAIIRCNNYSPAEREGFDEDLNEMAEVLGVSKSFTTSKEKLFNVVETPSVPFSIYSEKKTSSSKSATSQFTTARKIRKSRIDLNNEFFKRGEQCRKLMHNTVLLGDLVEDAFHGGWKLTTTKPPLKINWRKMSEEIMDFVMRENWTLASELGERHVEIIEGVADLIDNHTLRVRLEDFSEKEFTADVICIAFPAQCILPKDVPGALKYGITCDDFTRMNESPGKTLVVGALREGIECAGILASGRLPVTVVTRSRVLKGFDSEISDLIIQELRSKEVRFLEETNLVSIQMTPEKKLKATFTTLRSEEEEKNEGSEKKFFEDFDTVLFAVGKQVVMKEFDLSHLGIEVDSESQKINTDETSATTVPNIYAVGEVQAYRPESMEISELAGKLLGRRLFHESSELMDYSLIPSVIYTPTEYAFLGLAEQTAVNRFGNECIEIWYGSFKPLDYVIPRKEGDCFAKVIAVKSNGIIIGLHIFGPHAGEVIQGFAAAIRAGLKLNNFQKVAGFTGTVAQEVVKVRGLRSDNPVEEPVVE